MSTMDGVGASTGATETGAAGKPGVAVSVRSSGSVAAARGVGALGGFGQPAPTGFDPIAAVTAVARGAAAPPAAGLSAQLLDWAAPESRQFAAMTPSRLLPLLTIAVDRLATDAHRIDVVGDLGAVALERELRDHQALAERRATMIEG